VEVTFDSTGLDLDTYEATLYARSNDPINSLVEIPVTLNVVGKPVIDVSAASLETNLIPDETEDITFTVGNTGNADLLWEATDGAAWLDVDPESGTTLPDESTVVTATFDSAALEPDVYTTTLVISSNDPDTSEVTVPVTLTVTGVSDLELFKTASAAEVRIGVVITYTMVISYNGPHEATGVKLVDTLPAQVSFASSPDDCAEKTGVVTCNIGDLATGTITVTIVVTAEAEGLAVNTAEVSSVTFDPDLENNTKTAQTEIQPSMFEFFLPVVRRD
jgi:uncharacterized repeat protein (TIGR01451 family)